MNTWKMVEPNHIVGWLVITFILTIPLILIGVKNVLNNYFSTKLRLVKEELYRLDKKKIKGDLTDDQWEKNRASLFEQKGKYEKIINYIEMNLCIDAGCATTLSNILYSIFWIIGGCIMTFAAFVWFLAIPIYVCSLNSDINSYKKNYEIITSRNELTYEYFDALKQNKDIDEMVHETIILKPEYRKEIKDKYYFDIEDLNKKYKGSCYCGQYFQWEEE